MNITNSIELWIKNQKDKLSVQQIYAFFAVLIAGIIAHGYVIFNRISYHDNSACLFNLGGTYESGRWMLGIIYDLQMKTTKLFSVPVFNGLLSLVLIAVAAMLLVDLFKIQSKFLSALIGAIMVVYPVVTSIFSFMFTAWEYQLGLILAVLAAKILIEGRSVKSFILAVIVATISLGIYQAYLAVTVVLFLFTMFLGVIEDSVDSALAYFKTGIIYLAHLGITLVLWALIRKLTMALKHIQAVEYKGMNDGYSISQFPSLLAGSLKAFFEFGQAGINAVFYQRAFTALIVIITICQIVYLLISVKKAISLKLLSLVGIILLPIGMNMVYLLSTSSEYNVDSLMVYGDIFVFLIPIVLIEKLQAREFKINVFTKCVSAITWIQIVSIAVMTLGYTYTDNAAYLKAELAEQQATAYFNQMVTAIKTCDGFSDDMEIVLIGAEALDDGTFVKLDDNEQLDAIKIDKFPRYTDLVKYNGSLYFMREHLGFGNEKVMMDDGTYALDSKVQKMPTYPNDGSIAVVDGKVIVKMGKAN